MVASGSTSLTRSAVLAWIASHGATSRADLARALGVSPASMTSVVKQLLKTGLLKEAVAAPGGIGRPAVKLELVSDAGTAIGLKVAADHVTAVEVQLSGEIIRSLTEPFDTWSDSALLNLVRFVERFIDGRDSKSPVLGLGVAIPGNVENQAVGIADSTQIGWSNLPIGDFLRNALKIPVIVENNVNALAVALRIHGTASRHENMLIITLGSGVGAAVISDGLVMRGSSGSAAEFGHVPITPDGPLCQCGNLGCLEAYIGEQALTAEAVASGIISAEGDFGALVDAAADADERAVAIFETAASRLGVATAGAVNLLDPEIVLISGEAAHTWDYWKESFEEAFRAHLVPRKRATPVVVEPWSDDRWAQGAAGLILATPFDTLGVSGSQGELVRRLIQGVQLPGASGTGSARTKAVSSDGAAAR